MTQDVSGTSFMHTGSLGHGAPAACAHTSGTGVGDSVGVRVGQTVFSSTATGVLSFTMSASLLQMSVTAPLRVVPTLLFAIVIPVDPTLTLIPTKLAEDVFPSTVQFAAPSMKMPVSCVGGSAAVPAAFVPATLPRICPSSSMQEIPAMLLPFARFPSPAPVPPTMIPVPRIAKPPQESEA